MSRLSEYIDVQCPFHYLTHHAERYFTVHRRDQKPGIFSLTIDLSDVGFPGKVQARHDVHMHYTIRKDAEKHDVIDLRWDPDDRFVPTFDGTLSGERLDGGNSRLRLAGTYDAPLGRVGVVFDAILGRRIAAATANALLREIKQFVDADYKTALATTLASSPKE